MSAVLSSSDCEMRLAVLSRNGHWLAATNWSRVERRARLTKSTCGGRDAGVLLRVFPVENGRNEHAEAHQPWIFHLQTHLGGV